MGMETPWVWAVSVYEARLDVKVLVEDRVDRRARPETLDGASSDGAGGGGGGGDGALAAAARASALRGRRRPVGRSVGRP